MKGMRSGKYLLPSIVGRKNKVIFLAISGIVFGRDSTMLWNTPIKSEKKSAYKISCTINSDIYIIT
jgi:hypothetical protein